MITNSSIITILIIIVVLVIASLFSFLETASVAVSEYRLKVLKNKHSWANAAYKLKQGLNQVLIFSLFGNSLFNAVFTTLSTLLLAKFLSGMLHNLLLPISTMIIALFIIIFSEALPKIIAAQAPLTTLRIIAIPMYYIFVVSKPIIWIIDRLIFLITRLIRINGVSNVSLEEIKALISDKRTPFKEKHRAILLNSIDIELIPVKEVLIPLRTVEAINIMDDTNILIKKIYTTHHTRIIVYENNLDNIIGFIHTKDVLSLNKNNFTQKALYKIVRPISFVNDFMPIIKQINYAQKYRSRIFVVTNEYGDISGIACLEDMLEIVFGDFTTESPQQKSLVIVNEKNEFIVDGTMLLRELNELYHLNIKVGADALTINGLMLKMFNGIPNIGVCFRMNNLIFEVINVGDYWVERVRISYLFT
jgi:CBS domain containing-hemolysin-like protein